MLSDTADLINYPSGGGSAANSSPDVSPDKSPTYVASAAQFRRIERSSRRFSIAIDVWCRLEDVRDPWKSVAWVVVALFVAPCISLIVLFSSYPMSINVDKELSLISWAGIFVIAAVMVVEIFSSLVCEIEFGIVAHEELPSTYLKTAASAVSIVLLMQYFFLSSDMEYGLWIVVVLAGLMGIFAPLAFTFYTHAPSMINSEMQLVFRAFMSGCCSIMLLQVCVYI